MGDADVGEALRRALLAALDKPPDVVLNETCELRPAERQRRWNVELLQRYNELAPRFGCHTAAEIARRITRDPLERERVAQHVRRLIRRQLKNSSRSARFTA
jgi:hypothetical protein